MDKEKKYVNIILDRIKEIYGISTDIELSSFLCISQPRLAKWRSRGTIDIFIIIDKCRDSDLHWILTGEERPAGEGISENKELIDARKRIKKLEAQIEVLKDMLVEERKKHSELSDKERNLKRSDTNIPKLIERE